MGCKRLITNLNNLYVMSKLKRKSMEIRPEHIDALHLINRFMNICRVVDQTPKQFEKCMHKLYEEARNYGF